MHRCAITVATHKNPICLFALRVRGKKIRSLVMLPQYRADFVVTVAPEREEEKIHIMRCETIFFSNQSCFLFAVPEMLVHFNYLLPMFFFFFVIMC